MRRTHYQLLVLLGAMWGISFVLIKYAIADLSPLATSVWRSLIALAFISAIWATSPVLRAAWAEIRRRPAWAACLGALQIAVPFTLVHVGEGSIPAGVTGVLVATQVFFIGMLAPVFDVSERFTARQAGGVLVGLVGVALVVGLDFVDSTSALLGALAVLGAAVSYALGGFLVKLQYAHIDARATAYVAVAAGAILMAPAGLFTIPDSMPGERAILATITIGVVGTGLALAIYCHLVREIGAGRAALAAYLAPAFALLFAWLILDESLSPAGLAGIALIAVGVAIVGTTRPPASPAPAVEDDSPLETVPPIPDPALSRRP